jgi:nitrate/nitrite transport system substrate-binding protein
MAERPLSARALRQVIAEDRAEGLAPMTFAMVHPVSSHNYQLRYWLAAAGIDPERDLRLIVIPPSRMGANLRAGRIAGYCVGEPWNQAVVAEQLGVSLITGYEIWNNAPEKVLGVTAQWAEQFPNTHRAMIRALVEAAAWLDDPEHRSEAARLISAADYVDAPPAVIRRTLAGQFQYHPDIAAHSIPDFNVFHRYGANFPWRSHAIWFVTQMQRWGQVDRGVDARELAAQVYRPDIYREAVGALDLRIPAIDEKTEGLHKVPWTLDTPAGALAMGADAFFDDKTFNPADPAGYLQSFPVRHPAGRAAAFDQFIG